MKRSMTVQTGKRLLKIIVLVAGVIGLMAGGIFLVNYPLDELCMELPFFPVPSKQVELSVSQDGYYEITSAEEYTAFWEKVNSNEVGARGRLLEDIYLNDTENYSEWGQNAPENRSGVVEFFYGTFDGNGHTIYGLYSETGYGLVERNRGNITGLTIRDSLVTGATGDGIGGICKENYRLISGCNFGGEISTGEETNAWLDQAAGICCENTGIIEKCGFSGIFRVKWGWSAGQGAGICPDNRGEITGCYNCTDLTDTPWQQDRFYAIADQNESSCFVLCDSGWLLSETGQIIEFPQGQQDLISAWQEKDLYSLFVERDKTEDRFHLKEMLPVNRKKAKIYQLALKALLEDEMIRDLIWEAVLNQDGAMEQLEVTLEKGKVCLSNGEETLLIGAYPAVYDGAQAYEDSCAALWEQCGNILGNRGENDWHHYTWHLGDVSITEKEFVLYRTADEKQGFFWKQGEMLYQVEEKSGIPQQGAIEDGRGEGLADETDVMEALKKRISSLPEEDSDEEDVPENGDTSMYMTMLWKLWEDQLPTDGANWSSPKIRDEVYEQLAGSKKCIPPWEDLEKVERLVVKDFDIIGTLQDLKKLPNLKGLILKGNFEAEAGFDLTRETVPKLIELYVSNVKLDNIEFLEQMPQLTTLYIVSCGIKDISPIQSQKELWDVSFYGNVIDNLWPLRDCKKIRVLSLSYNDIGDISALASLTELEEVGLEANRISNIEALQWLPNLKKVNFNFNQVSDLSPLAEQTELVGLGAAGNCISDITPLRKLTKLENLSLEINMVQDISALRDMSKMEYLGLYDNEIRDLTPIKGFEQLAYLSVGENFSEDIGDLVFVPILVIARNGSRFCEEEEFKEAQAYLDSYYPQKELEAEDMVKGDLNGDGLTDVVVLGFSEIGEDDVYDDRRKAYPFIAQPEGGFKALAPLLVCGPDSGGVYGDPYQGMIISDGRLVIQVYGGSSWRWGFTDIYEYKKGEMAKRWELEIEHCTYTSGYNYKITDLESGDHRFYVIAGEWEQSTRKLLLEDYNSSPSAVEKEFNEKWRALLKEEELSLPGIHSDVYQPDIVEGGNGYNYVIHDTFYETKRTPDEVLLAAAEECFTEYWELPVRCYTSEEIKNNFDSLAGVSLPEKFYLGYTEDGIPEVLAYKGCTLNEDGSYTHKCTLWTVGAEYWLWEKDIYYDDAEGG